jgi:hypothetical protein
MAESICQWDAIAIRENYHYGKLLSAGLPMLTQGNG